MNGQHLSKHEIRVPNYINTFWKIQIQKKRLLYPEVKGQQTMTREENWKWTDERISANTGSHNKTLTRTLNNTSQAHQIGKKHDKPYK